MPSAWHHAVVPRRLPEPGTAVKAALKLMPHEPGVYIFRNAAGRVVYVGRSRDLAHRTRSYWTDLGDRRHLYRMVEQVAWVEPVLCESEHEAAFLESDLIERHRTRYNRTLGMESRVWLRLDAARRTPSIDVAHELQADDGAQWFGPYLGWQPAREAAAGLQRVHPLRYAGAHVSRSDRELGRSLGVHPGDLASLAREIAAVLRRDASAVKTTIGALERMRDAAAARLMFEYAASLHEQIRGIRWITQPQKLSLIGAVDADYSAVARFGPGVLRVVLALRRGRLEQRHVDRAASLDASPNPAAHEEWQEQAHRNAHLMARLLAADAVGPLGWR